MIYLQLFWSFFQIGLFSIGGGHAAMPLIQEQVVDIHGWITFTEFSDLVTIAEMTPGPISINAATFVGIQVADLRGAVVSTIGCIIPSCMSAAILAVIYSRFKDLSVVQEILRELRPAVVALIGSAGISIMMLAFWGESGALWDLNSLNVISVILFSVSLLLLKRFKINPVFVMLICGAAGGLIFR